MQGLFLINKSPGWTSHDVVAKIRRLLGIRKVGHAGTLDPDASGLLCVCIGKATKLIQYIQDKEKEYLVVMKLGVTTDTHDASGKVIKESHNFIISEEDIKEALEKFTGKIKQIPPMYSAKKIGGIPLYKLARRGKEIPRSPRTICIKEINLHEFSNPFVKFSVVCSKGTYIRTLCSDIGDYLGIGAIMWSLLRVRAGRFHLKDAITIEKLEKLREKALHESHMIPMEEIVLSMPSVRLRSGWEKKAMHGGFLTFPALYDIEGKLKSKEPVSIKSADGRLIAIGIAMDDITALLSDRDRKIIRIEKVLI